MTTIYENKKEILTLARIQNRIEDWEKIYSENETPVIYFYRRVYELKYCDKKGFKLVENLKHRITEKNKIPYTLKGRFHVFNGYKLNK